MLYDCAPTVLQMNVPDVGTLVAPSCGLSCTGSAVGQATFVVTLSVLLLEFGSGVVEDVTVAVFVIGALLLVTVNVDVMVALWPELRLPSAQGNGVEHAPLLPANVRPAGVGSLTLTFTAADGPLLSTKRVYVIVDPEPSVDGPDLFIDKSALCVIAT